MKVINAVAGLAAATTAFVFAPFAHAQSSDGFTLDRAEYEAGSTITLSHDVTAQCEGKASSKGFINGFSSGFRAGGPNTLVADASASWVPGSYTAEMTCKGKQVTREFKVVTAERDKFWLLPAEVEAGGDISVIKTKQSDCGEVATSPGFAAPIELRFESINTRIGNGKAVDRPGTYQAEMTCGGKQVQVQFVVTAKTSAPVVTKKPAVRAPIVKPKGAPQTGGGGTAR
jgi:hypothetical protein